jgi:hypothetical protein
MIPGKLLGVFGLLAAQLAAQVSVLTGQYDDARSGVNLHETKLNRSNVKTGAFGKRFSRDVDGYIYAQPLYVPNVAIPGAGTHNVVFVATMHNSIYAFDADSPEAGAPLWKNSDLGAPVPHENSLPLNINTAGSCKTGGSKPVKAALTGGTTLTPEVGILSTPVIDPSTQTLYAVAASLEHGDYCHKLHALDYRTGREKPGSPVVIEASVPGKDYFTRSGPVTFASARLLPDNRWAEHLQRAALSLVNGKVYVGFAVFHDPPVDPNPWHGWLMAYDAATLDQVAAYNTTSTGGGGGIWQSGRGAAADEQGNLYIATGNGDSDGSVNLSDSILKLSPSLSVAAHYSPPNQKVLNDADLDVGTAGPMVLTGKNLVVSGSKQGILYLFDLQMRLLDSFTATLPCAADAWDGCAQLRQYAYWPAVEPSLLYLWGSPIHQAGASPQKDTLRVYSLNTDTRKFDRTPVSVGSVMSGYPGGIVALSASGGQRDTGIVWATTSTDSAEGQTVPGVLRAFDASDVSHELWNSEMNPARDRLGALAKFAAPTVANGQVFVPTFSNQLVVYGLLPAPANP